MSNIIHTQATVEREPGRAFELFVESSLVGSWLVDRAEIEPRVGGKYDVLWDYEHYTAGTAGCKVTGIELGKFIPFEWKGPPQFQHTMNEADPLTHLVVFFIPSGESSTEVHLIHTGWGSSPEWEEARQWFVEAWELAFSHLAKHVASAVPVA